MMQITTGRCILRKNNFVQSRSKVNVPKALWGKPEELFEAGNSAHTEGQLELAENFYKKAIRADSNCHKASYNLAIVHHENGELNTAKTRFQSVLKKENLDQETRSLFAKGLAKIHQEQENYKLAIKYYTIALEGTPNDKDLLDNLGNAHASIGEIKPALGCFQQIVEFDPTDLNAKLKLAHTLQDYGEWKEATAFFDQIIALSPNHVEALVGNGVSMTHMIDDEEGNEKAIKKLKEGAEKFLQRAYILEPQNPQVLLNLGIFLVEHGDDKDKTMKGVIYLGQAVYLAPKDADLIASVAYIKFKYGEHREALMLYKDLLNLEPKNVDAWIQIGIIYQEKGKLKKALEYYQKGCELEPRNPQNRNLYGMMLQESGDLAGALEQYLAAVKEDRKNWSTHMNLASVYRQLNEIEKSDHHRAICNKINPESKKMFEEADAPDTETDASVDSVDWAQRQDESSDDYNYDDYDYDDYYDKDFHYEGSSYDYDYEPSSPYHEEPSVPKKLESSTNNPSDPSKNDETSDDTSDYTSDDTSDYTSDTSDYTSDDTSDDPSSSGKSAGSVSDSNRE
jgi:tetratricopeptide (TPR) repeat protein